MANPAHSADFQPKQSDKIISVDCDTTITNDSDRDNITDFS